MIQRGVQHVTGPVTPGPTHTVECNCGAKWDIIARSPELALERAIEIHRCQHISLKVTAIPK